MVWLRLVGSSKLQVSFAKEPYKRDHILQKRPMILRSLLSVATPYLRFHLLLWWPIHIANTTTNRLVTNQGNREIHYTTGNNESQATMGHLTPLLHMHIYTYIHSHIYTYTYAHIFIFFIYTWHHNHLYKYTHTYRFIYCIYTSIYICILSYTLYILDTTTNCHIPCVKVWCSVLQCVAVCCSVLQCTWHHYQPPHTLQPCCSGRRTSGTAPCGTPMYMYIYVYMCIIRISVFVCM